MKNLFIWFVRILKHKKNTLINVTDYNKRNLPTFYCTKYFQLRGCSYNKGEVLPTYIYDYNKLLKLYNDGFITISIQDHRDRKLREILAN